MKLPVKRGWTRYTIGTDRYQLDLWTQPWHLWFWAKVYHQYDMIFFRIPGVRALERQQQRRHKHKDSTEHCDRCMPLTARQDEKCYGFNHRQRKKLAEVMVTEEAYNQLKGHDE